MIAFPRRNGGGEMFRDRRRIVVETVARRAARRPGQLSVLSHGWELFSSDTSSYAHAHPIDFINPDSHLLGKKNRNMKFGNKIGSASPVSASILEGSSVVSAVMQLMFCTGCNGAAGCAATCK